MRRSWFQLGSVTKSGVGPTRWNAIYGRISGVKKGVGRWRIPSHLESTRPSAVEPAEAWPSPPDSLQSVGRAFLRVLQDTKSGTSTLVCPICSLANRRKWLV